MTRAHRFLPLLTLILLASCRRLPVDCQSCNDPAAKNYRPAATSDATCCVYGKVRPRVKTRLSEQVRETSGLLFANGQLWTHNDSGGANEIYAIDTINGSIRQTVVLTGATNVDWEDLTKSDTHLFVGDMGNNLGSRRNLRVYRFPLQALQSSQDTIRVAVETIHFNYADQTDFASRSKHNFDCEALVYAQGQLWLFTKNWQDNRCNLYTLPATPGTYQAQPAGSFDARGLVTGADISLSEKEVILVGYRKKFSVFLWTLSGYSSHGLLSGSRKRFRLGNVTRLGQLEAVGFRDSATLYFSSEKIPFLHPRLYRMPTSRLFHRTEKLAHPPEK